MKSQIFYKLVKGLKEMVITTSRYKQGVESVKKINIFARMSSTYV